MRSRNSIKTSMLIVFSLLILSSIAPADNAQLLKNSFTYEGLLKTNLGDPVKDGTYNMIFRIYDSLEGGNLLWESKSIKVETESGSFSTVIAPTDVSLDEPAYLSVQIDGDTQEMSPRQELFASNSDDSSDDPVITDVQDDWWAVSGSVLEAQGTYGLGRDRNNTYNDTPESHTNLGISSTTGGFYSTIPGGYSNEASVTYSTVSGGGLNVSDAYAATVSGGYSNNASGLYSTSGGGYSNIVGDASTDTAAYVGGGYDNTASGKYSTIAGGHLNTASGPHSTVAGGLSNTASGDHTAVSGGYTNTASSYYSTVSGGRSNEASGYYSAVSGGRYNDASGNYSAVSSGYSNDASGSYSAVSGGYSNEASGYSSTVSGGRNNEATETYSTISGGYSNDALSSYSIVSGGYGNIINSSSDYATISGGLVNEIAAAYSTISGGYDNSALSTYGTVGGGEENNIDNTSDYSTIGGGSSHNIVGATYGTIAGGYNNLVTGNYGVVPGGYQNHANGDFSLAAGYRATADHYGCFVWADSQAAEFASEEANAFLIRASGGVGIGTAAPRKELDVIGNARFSTGQIWCDTSYSIKFLRDGGYAAPAYAGALSITNDYTETPPTYGLYVKGDVGIGTNEPEAELNIADGYLQVGLTTGYYAQYKRNDIDFNRSDDGASYISKGDQGTLMLCTGGLGWDYARLNITSDGDVGIGTTSPSKTLDVSGTIKTQDLYPGNSQTEYEFIRFGDATDYYGGFMHTNEDVGYGDGDDFTIYAWNNRDIVLMNGTGETHFLTDKVGIGTTSPATELDVDGDLTVKDSICVLNSDDPSVKVVEIFADADGDGRIVINNLSGNPIVEIGEGLDYAESFSTNYAELDPGTIMAIDPTNPGKLQICNSPYDKKVAGIVAGANGLGTGVMLGTTGADGEHPIALAGRVYCKVDAKYGAVDPGDLLTTSPNPGYAMVVKDHAKSQGAIIGKAMESLAEGQEGQILVLVTLQ